MYIDNSCMWKKKIPFLEHYNDYNFNLKATVCKQCAHMGHIKNEDSVETPKKRAFSNPRLQATSNHHGRSCLSYLNVLCCLYILDQPSFRHIHTLVKWLVRPVFWRSKYVLVIGISKKCFFFLTRKWCHYKFWLLHFQSKMTGTLRCFMVADDHEVSVVCLKTQSSQNLSI